MVRLKFLIRPFFVINSRATLARSSTRKTTRQTVLSRPAVWHTQLIWDWIVLGWVIISRDCLIRQPGKPSILLARLTYSAKPQEGLGLSPAPEAPLFGECQQSQRHFAFAMCVWATALRLDPPYSCAELA